MLDFDKTCQGAPDEICCVLWVCKDPDISGTWEGLRCRAALEACTGRGWMLPSQKSSSCSCWRINFGSREPGLALLSQMIPCTPPFPCLRSSPCPKPSFPRVRFLPVSSFIYSYPGLFSVELVFCFFCPDTLQHRVPTTKLKKSPC